MSLYTPRKPNYPGARLSLWEQNFNGKFPFGNDNNGKFVYKGGQYFYVPNRSPSSSGGSGGLPWKTPKKELDPTESVSKCTLVYVSPMNPLATTGLIDLVTSALTTAQPGIWYSLKDIPAQTGTPPSYNVPQIAPQAVPTGTPLAGDIDSDTLFWLKWPETNNCL